MIKIRTNILNPLSPDETELLKDQIIIIQAERITQLRAYDVDQDHDSEDRRDCVLVPGLIDLHVHLSQYRIRGIHRPALLPWLEEVVFPEESRSANIDYSGHLAEEFFQALFRSGTTTSVIYTAPYKSAGETAFEVAEELGARAFIGMTMMDQNSPQDLLQNTQKSLEDSIELYEQWDQKTPLLNYIFTPRFAPTCSEHLMRALGIFIRANNAWLQTHLSENKDEIAWVKELFGLESYTQVYAEMGLLGPRSIFGHGIHLSDSEMRLLRESKSKIAHCPDSNFYLKSGEFPYQSVHDAGIEIGIGSDVGAGTTLDMLYHAKMACYRQSSFVITPQRLFYHISLGNAKLLGLETEIGSIEIGKQADLVLFKLPSDTACDDATLSRLCFYSHEFSVERTIIAGKIVHEA
ncbi:MAG: guanine deaminase [Candidatus Cloacimonadaceae bacterium]|nr:guanine deaminase [Candidatus Cloacimonadaceae bacterium]